MSRQKLRKHSRKNYSRKQIKKLVGGYIRDNVPQFSEFCGKNPLYDVLPPAETCTSCQGQRGGRRISKKKQRGGFIRDNVPQFSEFCGKNPLYDVLPPAETCTSCQGQKGGRRISKKRSIKKQKKFFYF